MKATVDLALFGRLIKWMAQYEQEEIRVAGIDGVFASYVDLEIADEERALPVRLVTALGTTGETENKVFTFRNPSSKIARGLVEVILGFSSKKLDVLIPEDTDWFESDAFLQAMEDKAVVAETTKQNGEDKLEIRVIETDGTVVRLLGVSGTLSDPPEDSPLVFTLPYRDEKEPSLLFDGERFAGRESEAMPNTILIADMQDLGLDPDDRESFIDISNRMTRSEIEPKGKFKVKKSAKSSIPVDNVEPEAEQNEAPAVEVPMLPGMEEPEQKAEKAEEAEETKDAETPEETKEDDKPAESLVEPPPAGSDTKDDESSGDTASEEEETKDDTGAESENDNAKDDEADDSSEDSEDDDNEDDDDGSGEDDESKNDDDKPKKRKRRSTEQLNQQAVDRLLKYGYSVEPPPQDGDEITMEGVMDQMVALESRMARARAMLEKLQEQQQETEQEPELDADSIITALKASGMKIKG